MHNYLFSKSRELNQEQWMNLVDQYQVSGLTQAGFCVQNGLALSTFQYWRRKAAAVSPASAALEFVEIDRTVFLDLEGSDESPKPVIEITDSDRTIRFFYRADPGLIAMVIRELGL